MPFVLVPGSGAVPDASVIGGKAHNLARLAAVPGIEVPPWLVIAARAFSEIATSAADSGETPADARLRILDLDLPESLAAELRPALRERGLMDTTVAVRSSATVEDAAAASYAGQFASALGVPVAEDLHALWRAIRTVWASAFSEHALSYASSAIGHTGPPHGVVMAVIVQALVPARAAGVAFSIDPVSGDREVAVISAVYGLGELLVSGDADADTFRVRFPGGEVARVEGTLATKSEALLADSRSPCGTIRVQVPPALTGEAAISEVQAVRIASVARALQDAFGTAQDIEWALASPLTAESAVHPPSPDDRLYVLQARPVTAVAPQDHQSGERRLWDNSNIVESYSGVTAPLTFSFARGVYEQVYRQFCQLLGVSDATIRQHEHVFANMLGSFDGRVYYNLLNWYRILALLPGYAMNRAFMERMMGVREQLADPPPPPGTGERSLDAARLARTAMRLWREHRKLDDEVVAFHSLVNVSLAPVEGKDLDRWSADDLLALYRRLEGELLHHWRAPLVNDFFAMIWFGVLGRLVERWLPDAQPTLVNDLLVGEGGIISTEPARRVMRLAALAAADPALLALFEGEPDDVQLLSRIRQAPELQSFSAEIDDYLARFGDRCIGELKLETITPLEEPEWVVRMTRAYLAPRQRDGGSTSGDHEQEVRVQAESYVRATLSGTRRRMFFMVLHHARRRIRDRENLRFERTRVFGAVRRIFRGMGHRLHEAGRLAAPRDVFLLTVDEIFAAIGGTGVTRDLQPLVALRASELAAFEQRPAPPDRFETFGIPTAPPPPPAAAGDGNAELRGMGCCPGVVRGRVQVVRDPAGISDIGGRILVAERTDPGWTLLFPTASGLLVQRGSLLSHSAIVAREIGLPCVVSIPRLMDVLQDDEWVEMDGATGIVRRIAAPEEQATT